MKSIKSAYLTKAALGWIIWEKEPTWDAQTNWWINGGNWIHLPDSVAESFFGKDIQKDSINRLLIKLV